MRLTRFYLPAAQHGAVLALPEAEAEHAMRVLRLAAGAKVRVFDGRGHEFAAVVIALSKSGVDVEVGEEIAPPATESSVGITLAMAALKSDHMDAVVRDATMLGVKAIQPLVSARTEVSLASLLHGRRCARWQRIAVSSAKQCGRAVVPVVLEPVSLAEWIGRWRNEDDGVERLVCVAPGVEVVTVPARDVAAPGSGGAVVLIGPEGGWSEEELCQLTPHARFIRAGGRTLRADVAPVVALTALMTVWGE
jgi:16S rRNA (uracil1498-N3)-methyltransferase